RDAAVGALTALRPRDAAGSRQRERLVVLGGDGAVAILDRVGAAALRLIERLGVSAARRRERIVDPLHEGDALLQHRQRVGADLAGDAAADPVFALDRIAGGRRHPALSAVAEGDLALDRVAEVVTRGRLAVEEVLDLVPADPGAAAVVVRLEGVGAFLLQDRLAVGRRRRIRLQDPEPRAGQDRGVGRLQALIDGPVGGAEDLDDGDAVERIHGV